MLASLDANLSTISAAINVLPADGSSSTEITIESRNSNGNLELIGGRSVVLSTTAGILTSVIDNNNGTYTATVIAPATESTAIITGSIDGDPIGDTAIVEFLEQPTGAIRLQQKFGTDIGNTNEATFDTTPIRGNLLVAISFHRADSATPTISGNDWELQIDNHFQTGTGDRRGFAVWTKIAGASEPSSITASWSPNRDNTLLIQEFEANPGFALEFIDAVANNSGSSTVTTLSTGTLTNPEEGNYLVVTALGARDGTGTVSWDNDVGEGIQTSGTRSVASGFGLYANYSSNFTSNASFGPTARYATAGLVAFAIVPKPPPANLYSYQSGNWNVPNNWTLDPSGTTLVGSRVPDADDQVTILNGRIITRTDNTIDVAGLTIQAGAVLDVSNTTGHEFNTVFGQGTIRLNTTVFPEGNFNAFHGAGGGTVEFYNLTTTIPTNQPEFNNLRIVNNTATNYTLTLASDLILNGNFTLRRTGSGTLTFQQGNNTTARTFEIRGSVNVGAGTSWTVNNANVYHQTTVNANFTNNGTVRFTNLTTPNYTADATNGVIVLTMAGAQNNLMALAGTTDLYRLIVDKGIDQTFILTVTSTNTANFRLLGRNNQGNNPAQNPSNANPEIFKALTINHGTLRLTENIIIDSLSEGGDDFWVRSTASLWIDGAEVYTTTTANGTSYQAITITGLLRITAGLLETRNASGIIYTADGVVTMEGGNIRAAQMRDTGGGRTAYIQRGGTVVLNGDGENAGGTPRFQLSSPDASFEMSGGVLDLRNPNNTANGGININVTTVNASVSGGQVIMTTTGGTNFQINTTAPFYDVVMNRTGGTGFVVMNSNLRILNNLTIEDAQNLSQNGNNLTVG
ncbi:MAG: Ig-like domain-containing protein, partial [Balneolales bacterium]|nr:Ig-like domain-containing protein [Balneolales bacterium]